MSVQEVPTAFKTSDGRKFTNKADAEKHQIIIESVAEFQKAADKLGRAVAESLRTADGQLFTFSRLTDYFYISKGWYGMPEITRVSFYIWNCHFDSYDGAKDLKDFSIYESKEGKIYNYKISELYCDHRKAQLASLDAQKAWLELCRESVEKSEQEINKR